MINTNFYLTNNNISKYTTFKNNGYGYSTSSKPKKIATGAASFIVPGLGQVINGETAKGIATFLGAVCSYLYFIRGGKNITLGRIGCLGISGWAAYDAYKNA